MARKKKVFISFDYEHDRHYRYLLNALANNANSEIEFRDGTPGEIDSDDVSRVKGVLTQRIREADLTLVIVGKYADSLHKDTKKIGQRNWQCWEVQQSYDEGNPLIAVKIDRSYDGPETLYNKGATWVNSFDVEDIAKAIKGA